MVDEIKLLVNWGNPDRDQALFSVDQMRFRRKEKKLKALCDCILTILTVLGFATAGLAIYFYWDAENPRHDEMKCIYNQNKYFSSIFVFGMTLFELVLLINILISITIKCFLRRDYQFEYERVRWQYYGNIAMMILVEACFVVTM